MSFKRSRNADSRLMVRFIKFVGVSIGLLAVLALSGCSGSASSGSNGYSPGLAEITNTVSVGGPPASLAVNPLTNNIYVGSWGNGGQCPSPQGGETITVIDGATDSTTTTAINGFELGGAPDALAVDSTTGTVYAMLYGGKWTCDGHDVGGDGGLSTIDGATLANSELYSTGLMIPFAIVLNPVTDKIYAGYPGITVIDGATKGFTTVQAPCWGEAGAVNPTTNRIYFVDGYGICVMDGATNSVSIVADPNAASPLNIAVNPVTNKFYVSNWSSNNISVIDDNTGTVTTVADPNAVNPGAVAVNTKTNKIYVVNAGSNNVTVIDGATNSVATVAAGIQPWALDVNAETNYVYVANLGVNGQPGSVTVIAGTTNATASLVDPKAVTPTAVVVNSVTNKIYVANVASNNVTVIAGAH